MKPKPICRTLMALGITALTMNFQLAVATEQTRDPISSAASAPIVGQGSVAANRYQSATWNAAMVPMVGRNDATANRLRETVVIGRRKAPYFCNRSLTLADANITRAIIVIHGSGRNVTDYYDAIMNTMPTDSEAAGVWRNKTIVLAPHFQEKDDARRDELWWEGDWNRGGERKDVSSFAVVDALVTRLRSGTFPNLKWIVITGHSAGGQFVQRYAAFTAIDLQPVTNAALVKFVPANPSSYVYLNEYRFDETQKAWVVPRGKKNKDYDDYKYGLDDLDDYARDRGPTWAQTYLPKRWVEVLAGQADVVANDSFDDSREAMWQGDSRYERALLFNAFMDRFYAPHRLKVTPIPNAGHDHRQIYASAEARQAIYFPD